MIKPYSQPGEKGTDTNQASELFELCKKVYELTSWKDTHSRLDDGNHTIRNEGNEVLLGSKQVPLYTSDYLLGKLLPITSIQLKRKANGNIRLFYFPEKPDYATYDYDTPLKCLLALTIFLSEAGELK